MAFPFVLAMNTSTFRPFGLTVPQQIETAARAGFGGIELWVRDIDAYVEGGGDPAALRRQAADAGISIVNGIAFFKWTDTDAAARKQGLQQARREIALLAEIGCAAVAAPPTGNVAGLDAPTVGANLSALLEVARPLGVEPVLEFWGRAVVLNTVNAAAAVLKECGDDRAAMLLDLFHMYTGGSAVADVAAVADPATGMVPAAAAGNCPVGLVHINDYPADPPRATIADSDRVMPGDGVGPVGEFLRTLHAIGYSGPLSVELFRNDYGEPDAAGTARQAREKTLRAWNAAQEGSR